MVQRRIEVCNNDVSYTNQYKEHENKKNGATVYAK